jgi:hypothetical protein
MATLLSGNATPHVTMSDDLLPEYDYRQAYHFDP